MRRGSGYFRLGLFVMVGLLLMAGLTVTFGLGTLFTETVPAESYFNESVEGLERGSPVKYRGVNVGSVSSVGFLADAYPLVDGDPERYVLVRMDLRRQIVDRLMIESVDRDLEKRIALGLRIRLTTQGLTGITYLEMDYLDPERNPLLPMTWTPQTTYIPSAPSTLSRLEAVLVNISTTLDSIAGIDFSQLVASVNAIIETLDEALRDADVANLGELLSRNLTDLHATVRRFNALVSGPEASALMTDASKAMASLRRMSEGAEADMLELVRTLRQGSESFGQTSEALRQVLADLDFRRGMTQFPEIMDNIRATSEDFSRAAERLGQAAGNVSDLTLGQRQNLEAVLANLNTLLDNLSALSEDLRQNPSRLLLGQPPREITPSPFEKR